METKKRYPVARRGLPSGGIKVAYREPPSFGGKKGEPPKPASAAKKDGEKLPPIDGAPEKGGGGKLPWETYDPPRNWTNKRRTSIDRLLWDAISPLSTHGRQQNNNMRTNNDGCDTSDNGNKNCTCK